MSMREAVEQALQSWLNNASERIKLQVAEETTRIRKALYPNVIYSTAIVIDDAKALPEPKEQAKT